jgi:hypothetical protein
MGNKLAPCEETPSAANRLAVYSGFMHKKGDIVKVHVCSTYWCFRLLCANHLWCLGLVRPHDRLLPTDDHSLSRMNQISLAQSWNRRYFILYNDNHMCYFEQEGTMFEVAKIIPTAVPGSIAAGGM